MVDADHARHQPAGVDDDAGAGLQDHLDAELRAEGLQRRDQLVDVVAGLIHEMATAEVHRLHLAQVGRELARDVLDQPHRTVGHALAQLVGVEDLELAPGQPVDLGPRRAEA